MYIRNKVDEYISEVERSLNENGTFNINDEILVGVDLGTAYVVVVALDSNKKPIATEMEYANVVKDGLVVDFVGATNIVKKLKKKIETRLGIELTKAAIAVPPGTSIRDAETHKYVVEGAGLEVTNILDEPTAANAVLNLENGVIVDIGGGTTGLSIVKNNHVVYTADEPTGGTHLSLVIAGNYKIDFEEAEKIKKMKENQKKIFTVVLPVVKKIAYIIKSHISKFDVETILLVGGTACLDGIEEVIARETGVKVEKPSNPLFVTPLGIAMNCKVEGSD